MEYTVEMQTYLDIDWFATDNNGNVIHFASGGGAIPASVALYKEDNEMLTKYFKGLEDYSDTVIINSELDDVERFPSKESKAKYLNCFITMTKKGLFVFDKSDLGYFVNNKYHLVSSPVIALRLDALPQEIKKVLLRTVFNGDITKVGFVTLEEIS